MWNYIISFLVKILVIMDNPQITKARSENYKSGIIDFLGLSMWVGISEAICFLPTFLSKKVKYLIVAIYALQYSIRLEYGIFFMKKNSTLTIDCSDNTFNKKNLPCKEKGDKFNEWLAGVIDGDGCFQVSKKGYASLEIVTQLRDKRILYLIKQKYGGAVKLHAGYNSLRYRLHHKAGLLNLINGVNGLMRNPTRILELGKICNLYGIELKSTQPLTKYSGWLAGFFDTDGSIYLNHESGQIFITGTQKNRLILDALVELYGGTIYPMIKQGAFKWTCNEKQEILFLVNDYFKVNPCRSEKLTRLSMVNRFYELRQSHAHLAKSNSDLGKVWKHFLVKWNSLLDKDRPTSFLDSKE